MSPRPKWIWQNTWTTSIFALIQSLTRQPPMSWFINIRPVLWSKTFLRGAWLPASPTARQARVSDFWGHWGRWEFGSFDFFPLKYPFLPPLFTIAFWYFVTKIVPTYCEKKCSSDQEKNLKFEAEGREFAKILRSLETVKGQNNFW